MERNILIPLVKRDWMTIQEAIRFTGLTRVKIMNAVSRGKLPNTAQTQEHTWLFYEGDLRAYMDTLKA